MCLETRKTLETRSGDRHLVSPTAAYRGHVAHVAPSRPGGFLVAARGVASVHGSQLLRVTSLACIFESRFLSAHNFSEGVLENA